jgi:type II secretory ATPase GspE/PulE/Tfp pilus assembly ATPase PilB-like protein
MGIEPFLVASTLELVIAQRLVRLLCTHCKRELDGAERADAELILPDHRGPLFGPVGCRECNGTGYSGRSGIFESMAMSASLRHAAGERASSQTLRDLAVAGGMVSLREDGLRLARDGKTSVVEVMRNTHSGTLGK